MSCNSKTRLLSMGSNGSGQLGLGHCDDMHRLTEVPLSMQGVGIAKLAAGGNHTLLLLEDGSLYTAGETSNGRCFKWGTANILDTSDGFTFKRVQFEIEGVVCSQFKHIAATWEASFAVLPNGHLIIAGTGTKGELGLGKDISLLHSAQEIPNFPPTGTEILDISASMAHVVTVLSNGEVYGWGAARKGQLGDPATICWTPRKLASVSFKARKAACGKDFTAVAGENGEILVLGTDKWKVKSDAPTQLPYLEELQASWSSIYVLLQSGRVVCWGRNDHKQLLPDNTAEVQRIAIGSEHGLLTTRSGELITWGWGEHGNCGAIPDSGELDFAPTVVTVDHTPTFIAAGCATSWVAFLDPYMMGEQRQD